MCFALRESSEQAGAPPRRSPLLHFKEIERNWKSLELGLLPGKATSGLQVGSGMGSPRPGVVTGCLTGKTLFLSAP